MRVSTIDGDLNMCQSGAVPLNDCIKPRGGTQRSPLGLYIRLLPFTPVYNGCRVILGTHIDRKRISNRI